MPAGNDPTAADELRRQYGEGAHIGNAEALIRAAQSSRSAVLNKVALTQVNLDETGKLDIGTLKSSRSKDAVCLDAVVRGNAVSAVFEDPESGRTWKEVLDKSGKPMKGAEVQEETTPDLTAASRGEREPGTEHGAAKAARARDDK